MITMTGIDFIGLMAEDVVGPAGYALTRHDRP